MKKTTPVNYEQANGKWFAFVWETTQSGETVKRYIPMTKEEEEKWNRK